MNSSNTGNGCTLEDCHTNLFALTDLAGIKWQKLSISDGTSYCVEPLDDPVLLSFTRCIKSDILCVWRRVPHTSGSMPMPHNLHGNKELWIFWYGEEPSQLKNHLAPELMEQDRGSWEMGLSYECRTLLFKALHNLIERCLLSQNFVRIGKWFVQPYPHYNTNTCGIIDKCSHLSVRFSFFLHGESTVCASIDVREHPPLRYLHPQHLAIATQTSVPIILAPYGLAATLTGQSYRETDHNTQKLLDEWREFYILPSWDRPDGSVYLDSCHVPPVVEVVLAGMRMKYPSCFVMLLAEKEAELLRQYGSNNVSSAEISSSSQVSSTPKQSGIPSVSMTSPTSPCIMSVKTGDSPTKSNPTPISGYLFVPTLEPGLERTGSTSTGQRITEKAWQDSTVSSGTSSQNRHQQAETQTDDKPALTWEYGEPLCKNSCVCNRCRSAKARANSANLNKPNPTHPTKHKQGEKSDKTEREKRHCQAPMPFHRRIGQTEATLQQKMDHMMQRIPPSALANVKLQQAVNSQNGIPQLRGNNTSTVDVNAESPHSAAPSPLVASQIQPSVNNNGDPTMPTLSPHPPSKKEETSGQTEVQCEPASDSQNVISNGEAPGMAPGAPLGPHQQNTNQDQFTNAKSQKAVVKTEPFSGEQPGNGEVLKQTNVNLWLDIQKQKLSLKTSLKRPALPSQGYQDDDEELVTDTLYNFSSINAFLEQPIKKCRIDQENFAGARPGPQPPSLHLLKSRQRDKSPPQMPQYDPYEFSDDSSSDPGNFSNPGFRNRREDSYSRNSPFGYKQEEEFGGRMSVDGYPTKSSLDLSPETPGTVPGLPAGALMREEDLKPKFDDLNNIFDTDSDPDPEPGHLISDLGPGDDGSQTVISRNTTSGKNVIQTTNIHELAQMFPTPPSHETQHTLSPGNITDNPSSMEIITKIEPMTFPSDDYVKSQIHDWSYVHKPPLISKYEGSSKYLPIELPSSHNELLQELHYEPSWSQYNNMPIMDKVHHQPPPPPPPPHPPGHYPNLPSVENIGSVGPKPPERMTSVEASPVTFGPNSAQQRTPRTPMSYELQSPASNASSYMKNINSVDNQATNSQRPEAHSLVVNVMLSDSVLNLFKDHNFDSCSMCVCNMNIKGTDMVTYIPDKTPEEQFLCTCGFSAVVNRKYGNNSGLFYEDEVDITGIRSKRFEHRKPSLASLLNHDKDQKDKFDGGEVMPQGLLLLLQSHFSTLFPSCMMPRHITTKPMYLPHPSNDMEIQDGSEACFSALEVGRQAADNCISHRLDDNTLRSLQLLHKWPFLQSARTPPNSQDVVRMLKSLNPLLQDAIQKKRMTRLWESVYTILGPLTWKDFHLLAGRGSKETSGPQPVPSLVVGYDKDWLSLSPFALRHWDRMMLEPYSKPRDMAYVIIAPDNKYILANVVDFFKELSRTYEACHFGRHRPFTKKFNDGILRINQNYYNKVSEDSMDDWFSNLGTSPIAVKLKQYTQVCSKYIAPFLSQQILDKSIFETPAASRPPPAQQQQQRPQMSESHSQPQMHSQGYHSQSQYQSSNMPSSQSSYNLGTMSGSSQAGTMSGSSQSAQDSQSGSQSQSGENKPKEGESSTSSTGRESSQDVDTDPLDSQLPCLVVYMVDPFTYGEDWDNVSRLATMGLLRCFQEMLKSLPDQLQQCTQLQIIPQQVILDFLEMTTTPYMKNLCLSVYTQSRRTLTHSIPGRSLTGFGPAAAAEQVLKSKQEHHVGAVQLYSPPFVLGNLKSSWLMDRDAADDAGVLLCAYCLSEDQRWLLASCTDQNGTLLETCTINIEIPNRNRRKKASARSIGLTKLWDFIIGVLSQTAKAWRLVIGRFGRLGHGELKGWACLLNKKNLQKTSKQLRQMCIQCEILGANDSPSKIVSACLVSMESHPTIHITPDSISVEERRSSNCQLSTPQDASCTHILVFPTSARAQATQEPQKDAHMDPLHGTDMGEKDLLSGIGGLTDDILDDFDDFLDFLPDTVADAQFPSNPNSPTPVGMAGGPNSPMDSGYAKAAGMVDLQEESTAVLQQTLLQQPLAMGFYVSTAKTGPLPRWFWGACPQREGICPVCFKAALHIHCQNIHQNPDEFDQSAKKHSHPLDSSLTCDVLRYVLETYNALSWLTIDSATSDRRSCLPAHFVVLMQLYHAINSLV